MTDPGIMKPVINVISNAPAKKTPASFLAGAKNLSSLSQRLRTGSIRGSMSRPLKHARSSFCLKRSTVEEVRAVRTRMTTPAIAATTLKTFLGFLSL